MEIIMAIQSETLPTKEEFFNYLLTKRRPEATNPDSPFARLALTVGAEAVVRTLDVVDGFTTPEPTDLQLAAFALHKVFSDETKLNLWVTIR